MTDNSLLYSANRPCLFEKFVPDELLREYYDHVAKDKDLFMLSFDEGSAYKIFIHAENKNTRGICRVFWDKQSIFAYLEACGFVESRAKVLEVSLKDIVNFAIKKHKQDEGRFDVIVSAYSGKRLIDVDFLYNPDCLMV